MKIKAHPFISKQTAIRIWFHCQWMSRPRGAIGLNKQALTDFLQQVGGLQLDSINVIERAHYLTLWSRFGNFDRQQLDTWIYREQAAYEYWGHEASILPITHLPLGRRRMKRFPPESWQNSSWWTRYQTSASSKRRVLERLRREGPLESSDFEKNAVDRAREERPEREVPVMPLAKEDKRSLQLLWHAGKTAISNRRHFRRVYDLSERVYPETDCASWIEYEDSWLLIGLRGNGIASERHLSNYFTAPKLKAPERKRVIERNLRKGRVIEVRLEGCEERHYMLPEYQDVLKRLEDPVGTTLVCPFDSLLWQRLRAEQWLDYHYRIEIYVPPSKRVYGYYVMPILHDGKLIGRIDPKLHRDRDTLEIKAVYLEKGVQRSKRLEHELRESCHELCQFLDAKSIEVPATWRILG